MIRQVHQASTCWSNHHNNWVIHRDWAGEDQESDNEFIGLNPYLDQTPWEEGEVYQCPSVPVYPGLVPSAYTQAKFAKFNYGLNCDLVIERSKKYKYTFGDFYHLWGIGQGHGVIKVDKIRNPQRIKTIRDLVKNPSNTFVT